MTYNSPAEWSPGQVRELVPKAAMRNVERALYTVVRRVDTPLGAPPADPEHSVTALSENDERV